MKESTVVCNQAATFNRCVNKIQEEVQDNLRLFLGELSKGKSSQKVNKGLLDLKDLVAFQQNVNFVLGNSMQYLADTIFCTGCQHDHTIFVQAANMSRLHQDSIPQAWVKPDTWCSLKGHCQI